MGQINSYEIEKKLVVFNQEKAILENILDVMSEVLGI